MPGITEWLSSHGLSEYADRFAKSRIDLSVLPDLTDDDLKELGIFLGDRRRILRLIAEFAPKPQSPAMLESRQPEEAERRQVTVMFADLVGSTALSTGMDPEDLRDVFAAYSTCAEETVSKFGGTVAQYMGDGILGYFGYPHAHEDDAEQAVRAGLELIAAVTELKTRVPRQVRIGIATGVVVVGNLTPSIVGETPNLAARLQSLAKPNMVVISDGTRRLLGHFFELEDLGARDLKGIAAPVQVWAVLRPTSLRRGRPSRAAVRRGRHRKITPDGRVYRTSPGRVLHPRALFLLPAAHQQRASPKHRPNGTRCRLCA
jgi:class 3 adenylate cyclase